MPRIVRAESETKLHDPTQVDTHPPPGAPQDSPPLMPDVGDHVGARRLSFRKELQAQLAAVQRELDLLGRKLDSNLEEASVAPWPSYGDDELRATAMHSTASAGLGWIGGRAVALESTGLSEWDRPAMMSSEQSPNQKDRWSVRSWEEIGHRDMTYLHSETDGKAPRKSWATRLGLSATVAAAKREGEYWLHGFVHGTPFTLATCAAIVLNAALCGMGADVLLHAAVAGTEHSRVWEVLEITFCIFFVFELFLRILADRGVFFRGPDWRWNWFDTFVVIMSILDLLVSSVASVNFGNVNTARIIRFVRVMRVLRVIRAVRAFHGLRTVVFAIFESMASLFWCLVVVCLVMYLFAIVFLYATMDYLTTEQGVDSQLKGELLRYYGGVPRALYTLFAAISGGVDWRECMQPLMAIHWGWEFVFSIYIFLMVIGVLNAVMGAWVAATQEIAARDQENMVKAEMQTLRQYTRRMRSFFHAADTDHSGMLSWSEFQARLRVPKVAACFQTLDLDVTQAKTLFKLMDKDDNGQVSMDEFLEGCIHLRGAAQSLDVNILLYQSKALNQKIHKLMDILESQLVAQVETSPRAAASLQLGLQTLRGAAPHPTPPSLSRFTASAPVCAPLAPGLPGTPGNGMD